MGEYLSTYQTMKKIIRSFFFDGQIFVHDRFLIIDGVEGYHIGASLKDAGKKCFGITKIGGADDINDIMNKAQLTGL